MKHLSLTLAGLLALCLAVPAAFAAETPATKPVGPLLGANDFLPTPEQPVGFRPNNAWYPGAGQPPLEFWNGTPGEVPVSGTFDALAAIHTNFRYEFCDDGGRRMDYAMLRRATTIFVLDRYDPLNLRAAMYAKTYVIHPAQFLIPLETVTAVGKSKETMRYVLRTTMPGQFCMGLSGAGGYVLPSDHPPIIEVAKESIALYKTRIRPLIREGNLYHVFLRPNGTDWDGVQLHDPAKGKGAVLLFKPNNKVDTRRIVLKGLDRTRIYALTFQDRPEQNTRKTGADLMDQGFDVIMTGQNVSEIVWVEESR